MSEGRSPRASVALPVYNGENFLAEAIESILAQTFGDFELIIGDNASTDATEEICRSYAARDHRIRYVRHSENIGAHPNYNRLFELSSGEYFKWAAHDDVCHPDLLLRCIEVLDRDPSVVVCYPRTVLIDEEGHSIKTEDSRPKLASLKPSTRFLEAYRDIATHPIFGVIRADVLRKTPLLGTYAGSDRVLMAELSLRGRFHEVQEALFLNRDHKLRYSRVYDYLKAHHAAAWYDPAQAERIIFPAWRHYAEYFRAISRAKLPLMDLIICYLGMMLWLARLRRLVELSIDPVLASVRFFRGVGKRGGPCE